MTKRKVNQKHNLFVGQKEADNSDRMEFDETNSVPVKMMIHLTKYELSEAVLGKPVVRVFDEENLRRLKTWVDQALGNAELTKKAPKKVKRKNPLRRHLIRFRELHGKHGLPYICRELNINVDQYNKLKAMV